MTRYWFGDSDDWSLATTSDGTVKKTAATKKYYDAQTGGAQWTDLLIGGTTAASSVSTDGLPVRFKGPDGVLAMWESSNDGPRVLVLSTDIPQVVLDAAEAAIAAAAAVAGGGATTDDAMTTIAEDTGSDFHAALVALFAPLAEPKATARAVAMSIALGGN